VQYCIEYIDNHPLVVYDHIALPMRRIVCKYSGIVCDDFECLVIRKGVRFDNPEGSVSVDREEVHGQQNGRMGQVSGRDRSTGRAALDLRTG
jgi:hypothetical protein